MFLRYECLGVCLNGVQLCSGRGIPCTVMSVDSMAHMDSCDNALYLCDPFTTFVFGELYKANCRFVWATTCLTVMPAVSTRRVNTCRCCDACCESRVVGLAVGTAMLENEVVPKYSIQYSTCLAHVTLMTSGLPDMLDVRRTTACKHMFRLVVSPST